MITKRVPKGIEMSGFEGKSQISLLHCVSISVVPPSNDIDGVGGSERPG